MQTKQRYTRIGVRGLVQQQHAHGTQWAIPIDSHVFNLLHMRCAKGSDGVMDLAGYRFVYGRLYKYKRGDSDQHTDFWRGFRSARSL